MSALTPFLSRTRTAYFTRRWLRPESTCPRARGSLAAIRPGRSPLCQHHTDTQEQRHLAALPHE